MKPRQIGLTITAVLLVVVAVIVGFRIFGPNSIGFIDSPTNGQLLPDGHEVIVSGWALDPEGVSKIEVELDSGPLTRAFYGIIRQDVAAIDLSKPEYLNSGFRAVIKVPEGHSNKVRLALFITDKEGNRTKVDSKQVNFSNRIEAVHSKQDKTVYVEDVSSPVLGFIDSPLEREILEVSESLLVTGWAIDPDGIKGIELELQNGERVSAQYGIEREDVFQQYPHFAESLQSGFRAKVELPDNVEHHRIRLFVVDTYGNRSLADRVNFSVSSEFLADKAALLKETESPDTSFRSKGFIDFPAKNLGVENQKELRVAGWAIDADGIESVQVTINGRLQSELTLGIKRSDVQNLYRQVAGSLQSGFEGSVSIEDLDPGDHSLAIYVTDKLGHRVKVAEQDFAIISPSIWIELLNQRPALKAASFAIAIATSNLANGGGAEIKQTFSAYESKTIRVAIRVPILYMRTTLGEPKDWMFDPDFNVKTMQDGLIVAEDALNDTIKYALKEQLPLVITLNGGIWSDARGAAPKWDLTDYLEQEVMNCQWNENGEVMPDNYLGRLPGSESNPQLARALTFNYYADTVRDYKKRNLQQAGQQIKAFKERHPELFLGVNLDPDVYLNPFFHGEQTYDYNPGTVRQFQEWLSGQGPYAKAGELYQKRRRPSLSLDEFNRLTRKSYSSWSALAPPSFSKLEKLKALFDQSSIHLWQQFRRHLVDMHYDELSLWLNQIGINSEYIYSSQGFAADMDPEVDVFPVRIDSPPVRHDTGGVSIEGAVPEGGHLGAIFYGRSATNDVTVETGESLFAEIRRHDPDWAVVEFNPAYLEYPNKQSDYKVAYRALRDMFNFGAKFVSPMAWNGWNGIYKDDPGYLSYTSFRNTPLEKAVKDFMVVFADAPRGMILWPFGTQRHADNDGWQVVGGNFSMQRLPGKILLSADSGNSKLVLESPKGQVISLDRIDTAVLGMTEHNGTLEMQFKDQQGNWLSAANPVRMEKLLKSVAGLLWPLKWREGLPDTVSQIRVVLTNDENFNEPIVLNHIALYPKVFEMSPIH